LTIEHGDDEGEISTIGDCAAPNPRREKLAAWCEELAAWCEELASYEPVGWIKHDKPREIAALLRGGRHD